MKNYKLLVNTSSKKYPIIIGDKIAENLNRIFKLNKINFNKCLFLIDNNLDKTKIKKITYPFRKKSKLIFFHSNEKNKNFKSILNILEILQKEDFNRNDCLITIGGGITGDTGGFAASLFKRGLKFINIPTTLLAQVDSSVGGKTGVNTIYGKNLIGSFYQPEIVISDTSFLKSLPKREITCGYGEILKHSIIKDRKFFNFLDKNIVNILNLKSPYIEKSILESCKIKQKIVQLDEKESGIRKILNFGHTFAHAYEAGLSYSKKLNHGEAVLLGMISAINFSKKTNVIITKDFNQIINHYQKANLPNNVKKYFSKKDISKLIRFMKNDKKNTSNNINLILLKYIGKVNYKNKFNTSKLKQFFLNFLDN